MNIIEKLKNSIENGAGVPFYYGSAETLNEVLDNAEYPAALAILLQQGAVTDVNGQYHERITLLVTFADLTTLDFESIDNEAIIDRCKQRAFRWLSSLRAGGLFNLINVNNTTRDYLQYDAIVTGFGVNVTLEEVQGYGACDFNDR